MSGRIVEIFEMELFQRNEIEIDPRKLEPGACIDVE